MKRIAGGVVAVAALLPACSARNGSDDGCASPPSHNSADQVVVEGDPWSGYAPFRHGEFPFLEGTDYEAVYVEQLCQDTRAEDLSLDRADIIVTTLDQYVLQQPEGAVVGVIDQSTGADALVLDTSTYSELRSAEDIPQLVEEFSARGTKPTLAYTANSPSEMLLNELANSTDALHLDNFHLVGVDQSAAALAMMNDGDAQLAVLWEPDTTAAVSNGDTVALSSADVPDSIVDVIVASDRAIEFEPEMVQAVVDTFYTGMDEYLADSGRTALIEMIASDGNFDSSDARSVVEGIKLYGTADAHSFMNEPLFPLDQPQMTQSLQSIGSLVALLHPEVDLDKARVDGSFVAKSFEEQSEAA